MALSELGVAQENAVDTATAAQVICTMNRNSFVISFILCTRSSTVLFLCFNLFCQFVSTNGSRDVAAVASSRAASIYGLDILEEKIQVMNLYF